MDFVDLALRSDTCAHVRVQAMGKCNSIIKGNRYCYESYIDPLKQNRYQSSLLCLYMTTTGGLQLTSMVTRIPRKEWPSGQL